MLVWLSHLKLQKLWPRLPDKCLAKGKKALNLYNKIF